VRTVMRPLAVLLLALAVTGALAGPPAAAITAAPVAVAAHPAATLADNGDGSSATAPPGPNINVQQQEADAAQSKHKLVVGIVAAGLLIIVYFGHRQRAKSRVRKKNLQNAKG